MKADWVQRTSGIAEIPRRRQRISGQSLSSRRPCRKGWVGCHVRCAGKDRRWVVVIVIRRSNVPVSYRYGVSSSIPGDEWYNDRTDSGDVQQRDSVTSVGRRRDGLCFGRAGLSRSGRRECLPTCSVPIDKHLTLAKACRARPFPSNTPSLHTAVFAG
jgi:hypothetical protein